MTGWIDIMYTPRRDMAIAINNYQASKKEEEDEQIETNQMEQPLQRSSKTNA